MTTTETMTQAQINELQQIEQALAQAQTELAQMLLRKIDYHQTEIAKAKAEFDMLDVRIFAANWHLFTLIFKGGQQARTIVYGAPTQEHARTIVSNAFVNCEYTVLDGDQSHGRAAGTYRCWYSSAAQEAQPHHDQMRTTTLEVQI
jgi:hypothetical protein